MYSNIDVLTYASYRRTFKHQRNYGAEWCLDRFPQYDINFKGPGGGLHLTFILTLSSNFLLICRLVERGADLTMTFTPCKFDALWSAAISNVFDPEIAEYVYGKMSQIQAAPCVLSEGGNMSAWDYLFVRFLRWLRPEQRIVLDRFIDSYGSTLLHHAVIDNKIANCRWLLEKRVDPRIQNYEGKTPLDIAEEKGCVGIINLLKQHARILESEDRGNASSSSTDRRVLET